MPRIVVIAGPNGAGKTTSAMRLLPSNLQIVEFVNADSIAAGLSPFSPQSAEIEAGRVMLERIRRLTMNKRNFAFETTLAARSFAPYLRRCRNQGYEVHLFYLWLRTPELAVSRVADRVHTGGHDVPEEVIRRRYISGLRNFFHLYIEIADSWVFYDNSGGRPLRIAFQNRPEERVVINEKTWEIVRGLAQ